MHAEGGASPHFVAQLWGTVSNYREGTEVSLCASVLFLCSDDPNSICKRCNDAGRFQCASLKPMIPQGLIALRDETLAIGTLHEASEAVTQDCEPPLGMNVT